MVDRSPNNSFGKHAVAICQRSGFKFPYREMVVEPGTGYLVHYSESDGKYNFKNHPQNKLYVKGVDERPVVKFGQDTND